MTPALIPLLRALRDGDTSPALLTQIQALVASNPELPQGLIGLLEDAPVEDAVGLLALLGADDLPLAAAVHDEAGAIELELDDDWQPVGDLLRNSLLGDAPAVDLAEAVMARLGAPALPVAQAVHHEAGAAELTDPVMVAVEGAWLSALLDSELSGPDHQAAVRRLADAPQARSQLTAFAGLGGDLREAVRSEAGEVSIWSQVASGIGLSDPDEVPGWDGALLTEAVRHEAGEADLSQAVMQRLARSAQAPAPVIPAPANRSWMLWMSVAVVLFAVGVWRSTDLPTSTTPARFAEVESEAEHDIYASAAEVVVESLEYADGVQVLQVEGDDGAFILWIEDDEEATL